MYLFCWELFVFSFFSLFPWSPFVGTYLRSFSGHFPFSWWLPLDWRRDILREETKSENWIGFCAQEEMRLSPRLNQHASGVILGVTAIINGLHSPVRHVQLHWSICMYYSWWWRRWPPSLHLPTSPEGCVFLSIVITWSSSTWLDRWVGKLCEPFLKRAFP